MTDRDSESILSWLQSSDQEFAASLDSLREDCLEKIQRIYSASPTELDKKSTDIEEAVSLLFKIKRLLSFPTTPVEDRDWMSLAREDFRAKRYDSALRNFQKAIANGFPSPDDLVLAGTCALYAGRIDYASSFADQALRLDEGEIQALVLKALVAYRKENYSEAYGYLLKAKQLREDHPAVVKYLPLVEKAMSTETFRVNSKEVAARLKRRWVRKPVAYDLIVNDYEQLSAMSVKVRSLSAGGCLIDPAFVPEEFDFILEFEGGGRVQGTAKRIYETQRKQIGLRFMKLSPQDEDLINQRLAAI